MQLFISKMIFLQVKNQLLISKMYFEWQPVIENTITDISN